MNSLKVVLDVLPCNILIHLSIIAGLERIVHATYMEALREAVDDIVLASLQVNNLGLERKEILKRDCRGALSS